MGMAPNMRHVISTLLFRFCSGRFGLVFFYNHQDVGASWGYACAVFVIPLVQSAQLSGALE
jgi:hypothetical protein